MPKVETSCTLRTRGVCNFNHGHVSKIIGIHTEEALQTLYRLKRDADDAPPHQRRVVKKLIRVQPVHNSPLDLSSISSIKSDSSSSVPHKRPAYKKKVIIKKRPLRPTTPKPRRRIVITRKRPISSNLVTASHEEELDQILPDNAQEQTFATLWENAATFTKETEDFEDANTNLKVIPLNTEEPSSATKAVPDISSIATTSTMSTLDLEHATFTSITDNFGLTTPEATTSGGVDAEEHLDHATFVTATEDFEFVTKEATRSGNDVEAEVETEANLETKTEAKSEAKTEAKTEATEEAKEGAKGGVKEEAKGEVKVRDDASPTSTSEEEDGNYEVPREVVQNLPDYEPYFPELTESLDDPVILLKTTILSSVEYETKTVVESRLRTYTFVVTRVSGDEQVVTSTTEVRPQIKTTTVTEPTTKYRTVTLLDLDATETLPFIPLTVNPSAESSTHFFTGLPGEFRPLPFAPCNILILFFICLQPLTIFFSVCL